MEVVETLHQAHLEFILAPADTDVKVELCSPRNPVTLWRVEVTPTGQKRDVWTGQTRTLTTAVTGKNPIWNTSPSLVRRVKNKLNWRWAWRGASTCEQVVVTGQTPRNCPGKVTELNRSHSHWCGLPLLLWECSRASKPWSKHNPLQVNRGGRG